MPLWWYVARVIRNVPAKHPSMKVLFGQRPYADGFFAVGDVVWLRKEDDGHWIVTQPVPGGRLARVESSFLSEFLKAEQPASV